jgi:hypothetical protein
MSFRTWQPPVLTTPSIARAPNVGAQALPALLDCVRSSLSSIDVMYQFIGRRDHSRSFGKDCEHTAAAHA